MEEVKIYSTVDQLEEFKESVVWSDMVREMKAWQQGFAMEQDSIVDDAAEKHPSTAEVLMHIGDLNGRRKAIDYVLSIIDVFISMKEEEKKDES